VLRELTILVDSREQRPLVFPRNLVVGTPGSSTSLATIRLNTREETLPTGDYVVQGHEAACVIERKANLPELARNLHTADGLRRLRNEFTRMQAFRRRLLLLEGGPLQHQSRTSASRNHSILPEAVRDDLFRLTGEYGIELWMIPISSASARHACSEWVASLLFVEANRPPPVSAVAGAATDVSDLGSPFRAGSPG
jgi:ERCC4-type nuclease